MYLLVSKYLLTVYVLGVPPLLKYMSSFFQFLAGLTVPRFYWSSVRPLGGQRAATLGGIPSHKRPNKAAFLGVAF